ncbi:DUF692 family multinuclear iron-containing protein [Paenibacillus popilliae]
MLLDITNLYINSVNFKYNACNFFDNLPKDKINVVHISGFKNEPGFLIDSHSEPLNKEVLALLNYVLKKAPVEKVILERDLNLESLNDVRNDLEIVKSMV